MSNGTATTSAAVVHTVASLRDVIDVRLAAMDQAVLLLQHAANRKPTIGELEAKFDEKFKAIELVLRERECAVKKAETATNESLRQLQALSQSSVSGLNDQLQDMKSRVDRGEGGTVRERETQIHNRNMNLDNRGLIFSIIASIAAIGAVIISILNFAKLH